MPLKVLVLALVLTISNVVIHSLGTHLLLMRPVRSLKPQSTGGWPPILRLALLVISLLLMHLAEAGCWAVAYYLGGELPDFSTCAYFSLTSYSTVGFGDVLLPTSSRLLGPIESVVGVLMLGWSTAVIVASVQRVYREAGPF